MKLRIASEVFKTPYNKQPDPPRIKEVSNLYHVTLSPDHRPIPYGAGIEPLKRIRTSEGLRCPAILVFSNPLKVGSAKTPWEDRFDIDHGRVCYYGDNKWDPENPYIRPEDRPGNREMLNAFQIHNASDYETRKHAVPIIVFKQVLHEGRQGGFHQLQGVGVVEAVELVTQHDNQQRYFTNFRFDLAILSLQHEDEYLDWEWITRRRNRELILEKTLDVAPVSWRGWILGGTNVLEKWRRNVTKMMVVKPKQQIPVPNSPEAKILGQIYEYYSDRESECHGKHGFEVLAAFITSHMLRQSGGNYVQGWITPRSADGGIDFIGRLDIGSGFKPVKLIVAGQAKCEKPTSGTSGQDIARTAARLKRGWLGVYVTTSYFTEANQREIIEDEYPILLINGFDLAREVRSIVLQGNYKDVISLLNELDQQYSDAIKKRLPEEVLYM